MGTSRPSTIARTMGLRSLSSLLLLSSCLHSVPRSDTAPRGNSAVTALPRATERARCALPDLISGVLLNRLRRTVVSPSESHMRDHLSLSMMTADSVVSQSDEKICGLALAALKEKSKIPRLVTRVHVVRIADKYVVVDPDQVNPMSEYLNALVFDTNFVYLTSFGF